MILTVKNMVCDRCKIVVKNILSNLGIEAEYVVIGEVMVKDRLSNFKLRQLDAALKETGLGLVFDKTNQIVQKITNIIVETVHYSNEPLVMKFSCYLSSKLNYNYTYLANTFKKVNGISIERYIISQKIEKVKRMLTTEGVFLSEIAYKMNYSSVSHLSAQFKKETGINAKDYKLAYKNSSWRELPTLIAV